MDELMQSDSSGSDNEDWKQEVVTQEDNSNEGIYSEGKQDKDDGDKEESINDIDKEAEDVYTQEDDSMDEYDTSSTDSSSSGTEDFKDDLATRNDMVKQFDKMLQEMETKFTDYNECMTFYNVAQATKEINRIRVAHELFSSVYPLSSNIWESYIDVEVLEVQTDEDIIKVANLYKKALKDYYSFPLALKYLTWAEYCPDLHDIYNAILPVYGLNFMSGKLLYAKYRKYIVDQLSVDIECTKDLPDPLSKLMPANVKRYLDSFIQQISKPIKGLDECYTEFNMLYEKCADLFSTEYNIDWPTISQTYTEAKMVYEMIEPFEEQLNEIDFVERDKRELIVQLYKQYINALKAIDLSEDNPLKSCVFVLIHTIYERMVRDCWSNETCWVDFIDFMLETKMDASRALINGQLVANCVDELSTRSLRNCFWSVDLYCQRLKVYEFLGKNREEIKAVMEEGLGASSQIPENTLCLWIEYLTILRRLTDFSNEDSCNLLRKNFDYALTAIKVQWRDQIIVDPNCEILQLWALLEYGPLKNPERGKELWTSILSNMNNVSKSLLWLQYINLEFNRGGIEAARSLFQEALFVPNLDDRYTLAKDWECFERCYGTSDTIQLAMKECKAATTYKQFTQNNSTSIATGKRKMNKNCRNNNRHEPVKKMLRSNTEKGEDRKDKCTKMKDKGNVIANLDRLEGVNPKKPKKTEAKEDKEDNGSDKLRVFLSNLDYNLKEDEIREELSNLNITKIELVRSGNGRSRGFAYAELSNEDEVQKALSLDRTFVCGRPVFISAVARDKEQRQKFKFSGELEPCKLFIRGLPPDTTKEDLQKLFRSYGSLKDIRLVHHKSGKFKNLAYVEYEIESSASKAVLATDQMSFKGHTLSVAISAPPVRPTATEDPKKEDRKETSSIGKLQLDGGKIVRQRPNPRMFLIPTAVRNNYMSNKEKSASGTTTKKEEQAATKKSNDDFRKMILQ